MNHLKTSYKLITFDVTNTLLKLKTPVGEQYAKAGRLFGIQRDPAKIAKLFLEQWKIMNRNYPNYGKSQGISSHAWWKKLVEKSFYSENHQLSSCELDELSNHIYKLYETDACWEVAHGAVSLLEKIKLEKIQLGVISNFDERLETILNATGLRSYFDFVLASYVVGFAKPEREIFEMGLKRAMCSASQAVHIGDNVELDYLAAKRSGWDAVLVVGEIQMKDLPEEVVTAEVVKDIPSLESYMHLKSSC